MMLVILPSQIQDSPCHLLFICILGAPMSAFFLVKSHLSALCSNDGHVNVASIFNLIVCPFLFPIFTSMLFQWLTNLELHTFMSCYDEFISFMVISESCALHSWPQKVSSNTNGNQIYLMVTHSHLHTEDIFMICDCCWWRSSEHDSRRRLQKIDRTAA